MTGTSRDTQNGEHRENQPDPWSTPIEDDESGSTDAAEVEGGGSPSLSSATAPAPGIADAAREEAAAAKAGVGEPPQPLAADQREHPADFADGYDDRQEDALPGAARETPEEVVEGDERTD